MDKKKVVIISDFDFRGSGYLNIVVPMCKGISSQYDIKAIGLGYRGEEHTFDFSIIPCSSMADARTMLSNLHYMWNPEICIVALDIPRQAQFLEICKSFAIKTISIVPLENPPLTLSWSYILQQSDKVFFISQLGADEGVRVGLPTSEHLVVGMDTESWRFRTADEYAVGRERMNISTDTLVVLTVADNQERKNLSKAMEIVSKVKKEKGIKVRYILITKENSEVGWKLRDLAMQYGIASELMIFERGLSFKELYALYAISDVFLLTSKAEGLCMPVLESMSVGVPVVATACGALPELLSDGRGFLMETEYSMIDPWGNSRRDFPSSESGADCLEYVFQSHGLLTAPDKARIYMESRTWDKPIQQVIEAMENLTNEKK